MQELLIILITILSMVALFEFVSLAIFGFWAGDSVGGLVIADAMGGGYGINPFDSTIIGTSNGYIATTVTKIFCKYCYDGITKCQIPRWSKTHKQIEELYRKKINEAVKPENN